MCAAALNAGAVNLDFTYDTFGGIQRKYGSNRAETVSVAVFVGPDLEGKQVTGLYVPVYAQTGKITNISGWTSSSLESDNAFNVPDGEIAAGTFGDDHMLRITFNSPVTVPAEGFYVGYTYSATTRLSGSSAAMVEGNRKGECFYLASASQKTWTDLYELDRMASAMTVTMTGDFLTGDASVICDGPLLGLDTKSFEAIITNNGSEPLKSISYSYSTDNGISGSGSISLDREIDPVYGHGVRADIPIDKISEPGEYNLTLTITGVNGNEVSAGNTLKTPISAQLFVPVYRPIVEEYTYLNCGYCPRGYVMLEQMKSKYGSKFIGVSYHSSDNEYGAMDCIPDKQKPLYPITGYPAASLSRGERINPAAVETRWRTEATRTAICGINADLCWSNESHTQLVMTGKVRFLENLTNHSYRIAYILTGDKLSNNNWMQANSFTNEEAVGTYTEPFWNLFVGQPHYLRSLEFNDIALAMSDYKGIDGSLPATIEKGKEYEFSYTFNPADIRNQKNQEIVTDYNRIRCIVMIVDSETGRAVNCISTLYPDGSDPFAHREDIDWTPVIDEDTEIGTTGIDSPGFNAQAADTVYYDINGIRVSSPSHGDLLIRVEILKNGTKRYSKIIY